MSLLAIILDVTLIFDMTFPNVPCGSGSKSLQSHSQVDFGGGGGTDSDQCLLQRCLENAQSSFPTPSLAWVGKFLRFCTLVLQAGSCSAPSLEA